MCLQSHKEQQGTRFARVKWGKKVPESPSIQEQWEAKRGKSETERESSTLTKRGSKQLFCQARISKRSFGNSD